MSCKSHEILSFFLATFEIFSETFGHKMNYEFNLHCVTLNPRSMFCQEVADFPAVFFHFCICHEELLTNNENNHQFRGVINYNQEMYKGCSATCEIRCSVESHHPLWQPCILDWSAMLSTQSWSFTFYLGPFELLCFELSSSIFCNLFIDKHISRTRDCKHYSSVVCILL